MKMILSRRLMILPLLIAAIGTASAAVNITTEGVSVDFSTSPAGADFSAVSVAGAGGDLSISGTEANGLENPGNGVSVTLAWPATVTSWTAAGSFLATEPATSALTANVRYVTSPGLFLTGPTGNRYQALIGRFRNTTGFPLISFDLRWSLGNPVAAGGTGAPGTDPLAGIHIFYSKTGAANSWTLFSGPYALNGPVPSETLVVPGRLNDNADIYIAWVDDNGPGGGTAPNLEGHFTIDDVQILNVVTGAPPCLLTAALTPPLRQPGVDPADTSDDVVTFSATIQTPRDPGAGWVILGNNPYFATVGSYGVRQDFSIPIEAFSSGPLLFRFEDQADANCSFETTITAPPYIHRVTATNSPRITFTLSAAGDGAYTPALTDSAEPAWSGGVSGAITNSNVQTQPLPSSGSLKYFHLTTTGVSFTTDGIDVSALRGGILRGSVDFSFYSTNASGLESGDELNARIEIAADGDFSNTAAGNITSTYIRNVPPGDAPAFGASIAAGPAYLNLGTGANQTPFPSAPFTFHTLAASAPVPAGASSPFARIIVQTVAGITTSEHILIDNITFSANTTPTLDVSVAGAATWSNGNTLTAADDGFTVPVRIIGYNLGASTGWISNENPARTGLYSTAGPVTFGPFPGRTPFSLQLRDALASPAVTSSVVNLAPPSASLSAGVVTGSIQRQDNGPGAADDTATLTITVAANNLGPQFTVTPVLLPVTISGAGAYPAAGTPLMLTLGNLPMTQTTMNLEIADASYPLAVTPVTLEIVIPAASVAETVVVGRRDFFSGTANVQATGTPGVQWVPFPASRSLVMASAPASGDAVVETEVLDLSSTGAVNFTATLAALELGTTSNFETGDRFRAELIIDGDTANPVNLVDAFDTGSGFSATSSATGGQNGPKNGYINGYTGTAARDLLTNIDYSVSPLTSRDEYNANRARDEFNTGLETGTALLNRGIPLSATISGTANSAQLRILGGGISGTEAFILKDVLFTETTGGDSDGDGASDAQESIAGTNPADPHDVLRLSRSATVPGQIQFSSKPGRFYRVYVSDDADGSPLMAWRDGGLGTITGDGGVRQFSINPQPGKPRRYFRLHVMQSNGPWAP